MDLVFCGLAAGFVAALAVDAGFADFGTGFDTGFGTGFDTGFLAAFNAVVFTADFFTAGFFAVFTADFFTVFTADFFADFVLGMSCSLSVPVDYQLLRLFSESTRTDDTVRSAARALEDPNVSLNSIFDFDFDFDFDWNSIITRQIDLILTPG